MKDERIIQSRKNIASKGFTIWYFMLLAALLYRQFYLKQSFSEYWDIAVVFLVGTVVVSLMLFAQGAIQDSSLRRFTLLAAPSALAGGVAARLLSANAMSIGEILTTILFGSIGFFAVMLVFYLLYKRWERRI